MADRPDYNRSRRPPPRKSWEEADEYREDQGSGFRVERPQPNDRNPGRSPARRPGRGGMRFDPEEQDEKEKSPIQSVGSNWGGSKETAEEGKDRSKRNRKHLFKTLQGQALCLVIVFGMMAAFGCIASDSSGDYMGQSPQLRTVRMIISRKDGAVDAVLSYGNTGALELDEGHGAVNINPDHTLSLDFSTPIRWRQPDQRVWLVNFTGKIDNNQVEGTLSDATGEYPVRLEKNLFNSLMNIVQGHAPQLPGFRPPSIFNEQKAKPVGATMWKG
jgi:hypothetical protein